MTDAAQSLFTWWGVMADMHTKYGTAPDIEDKPEWGALKKAQKGVLRELTRLTGAPPEFLLNTVQNSMFEVLGVEEPIALTLLQAQAIVKSVVQRAALEESRMLSAKGLLN